MTSARPFHFASDSSFSRAAGTDSLVFLTTRFVLDDDPDEDPDEDDDFGDDEEGDDEEDEEDDDEDPDTETWQVSFSRGAAKGWLRLTSGGELPRLAPISQLI